MGKGIIIKFILTIVALVLFYLLIFKIDNYFDSMVKYETMKCQNQAYMIYKNYDNQVDEIRDKDWLYRTSGCAEIEAAYMSRDF